MEPGMLFSSWFHQCACRAGFLLLSTNVGALTFGWTFGFGLANFF
jgi:hypothetical protein